MKGISFFILLMLLSLSLAQVDDTDLPKKRKTTFAGHSNLIGSYYHLGSYSKERPFGFIEQTIEIIPAKTPQFRFGLGTGLNLYPGTAVVPIFATFHYVKTFNDKWNFSLIQSYGRNIKTGLSGFNSNRYYGDIGAIWNFVPDLGLSFGMGYILNWDQWGGKSLSFTGSAGIYYLFLRNNKNFK